MEKTEVEIVKRISKKLEEISKDYPNYIIDMDITIKEHSKHILN